MSAVPFVRIARTDAPPPANRAEREAKVASQRQLAFKSPPMTEGERRDFAVSVARQRMRDEGRVGLFQ